MGFFNILFCEFICEIILKFVGFKIKEIKKSVNQEMTDTQKYKLQIMNVKLKNVAIHHEPLHYVYNITNIILWT